jgi:hypothetical protein
MSEAKKSRRRLMKGATEIVTVLEPAWAADSELKPAFTRAQQEEFLEMLRDGMRRGAAAAALKLERRFVLDFIAENEVFEAEVLDAEGEATEHIEEAIYHAAISGSVAAAKLWMDLRKPRQSNLPVLFEPEASDAGESMDAELEAILRLASE